MAKSRGLWNTFLINLRLPKSWVKITVIPTPNEPNRNNMDTILQQRKFKFSTKTLIEFIVLTVLSKDSHRATETLKILGDLGFNIPSGTIYPFFAELKQKGLVTRRLEELDYGTAHMYSITQDGKMRLSFLREKWVDLNRGLRKLQNLRSTS
jgi:DNA-binding PadR family transcriptional regulator